MQIDKIKLISIKNIPMCNKGYCFHMQWVDYIQITVVNVIVSSYELSFAQKMSARAGINTIATIMYRTALIDPDDSLPVDGLHIVSLRGSNSNLAASVGHAQSTSGVVAVIGSHLSGVTGYLSSKHYAYE